MGAFSYAINREVVKKMQREYKVNITETVVRHMWVLADDPQDAIDIVEKSYSSGDVLDIGLDVDPRDRREQR